MKTAWSLALITIGAILAFAVTAHPSWLSFHVTGWVLIVSGVLGLVLPRRGYGWLRRRVVLSPNANRTQAGQRRFSRMLVPGGVMAESRHAPALDTPVKSETIEEYQEE